MFLTRVLMINICSFNSNYLYKNQNLENFIKTLFPNSPNMIIIPPLVVYCGGDRTHIYNSKHNKQTN